MLIAFSMNLTKRGVSWVPAKIWLNSFFLGALWLNSRLGTYKLGNMRVWHLSDKPVNATWNDFYKGVITNCVGQKLKKEHHRAYNDDELSRDETYRRAWRGIHGKLPGLCQHPRNKGGSDLCVFCWIPYERPHPPTSNHGTYVWAKLIHARGGNSQRCYLGW